MTTRYFLSELLTTCLLVATNPSAVMINPEPASRLSEVKPNKSCSIPSPMILTTAELTLSTASTVAELSSTWIVCLRSDSAPLLSVTTTRRPKKYPPTPPAATAKGTLTKRVTTKVPQLKFFAGRFCIAGLREDTEELISGSIVRCLIKLAGLL